LKNGGAFSRQLKEVSDLFANILVHNSNEPRARCEGDFFFFQFRKNFYPVNIKG